jgi:hypothetical protein
VAAGNDPNGGPRGPLTWANLISSVAVIGVAAAGGWTLFQSQFASMEKSIAIQAKINEENARLLAEEFRRFQDASEKDRYDVHLELRHDFIRKDEFNQFEQRLESIQKRLDIIEQTRPTTGELQSTAQAVGHQLEFVQKQLDLVESRQADALKSSARNPVEAREIDLVISELGKQISTVNKRLDDLTAKTMLSAPR